jgi:hypothetical protein
MTRKHHNFERRHYVALANVVREARVRAHYSDSPAEAVNDIAQAMADVFRADNPNFRPTDWEAACGLVNGFDHAEAAR